MLGLREHRGVQHLFRRVDQWVHMRSFRLVADWLRSCEEWIGWIENKTDATVSIGIVCPH
jgi:hypothetical protein